MKKLYRCTKEIFIQPTTINPAKKVITDWRKKLRYPQKWHLKKRIRQNAQPQKGGAVDKICGL